MAIVYIGPEVYTSRTAHCPGSLHHGASPEHAPPGSTHLYCIDPTAIDGLGWVVTVTITVTVIYIRFCIYV